MTDFQESQLIKEIQRLADQAIYIYVCWPRNMALDLDIWQII
jgi:hypothetical protein